MAMTMAAEQQRHQLYTLLGDLPERNRPITCRTVAVESCADYVLERLVLDLNGLEPVSANFIKPHKQHPPAPAVLYNHAHGGDYSLGKDELILGTNFLSEPPYASDLACQGYCALCIDAWAFGDRAGRTESEIFKDLLWSGRTMWGMMVYDSLRALDYLVSRPDIDSARIATLGMSMGSTMSWWLAALDTRIKVCVDICCLTDFQALIDSQGLDLHGFYYYVPSLLKHFTTADINKLIVPRPHLSLVGTRDPLTPLAGLERINKELTEAYQNEDALDAWKLRYFDVGHQETAEMRRAVLAFLEARL